MIAPPDHPDLGEWRANYIRDPKMSRLFRRGWWLIGGAFLVLVLIVLGAVLASDASQWVSMLFTQTCGVIVASVAWYFVVGSMERANPQQVTVYARGMTVRYPEVTLQLAWSQVDLDVQINTRKDSVSYVLVDVSGRRHRLDLLSNTVGLIDDIQRNKVVRR